MAIDVIVSADVHEHFDDHDVAVVAIVILIVVIATGV